MRLIPGVLGRIPRPSLGRGVAPLALRLTLLIGLSAGTLIGLAGSSTAGATGAITVDHTEVQMLASGDGGFGDFVRQVDFTSFEDAVTDSGGNGRGTYTSNARQNTSVDLSNGTLAINSLADSDATVTCTSCSDQGGAQGVASNVFFADFTLAEGTPFTFQGEIGTASTFQPGKSCSRTTALIKSEDTGNNVFFREVTSPSGCGDLSGGTSFDEQGVLPAGKYRVEVRQTAAAVSLAQGTFSGSTSSNVSLTLNSCPTTANVSRSDSDRTYARTI